MAAWTLSHPGSACRVVYARVRAYGVARLSLASSVYRVSPIAIASLARPYVAPIALASVSRYRLVSCLWCLHCRPGCPVFVFATRRWNGLFSMVLDTPLALCTESGYSGNYRKAAGQGKPHRHSPSGSRLPPLNPLNQESRYIKWKQT